MMNRPDHGTRAGKQSLLRYRPRRLRLASGRARRPIRPLLAMVAALLVALAPGAIRWLQEAPKIEPPFETMIDDGRRPASGSELGDTHGQLADGTKVPSEPVTFTKDVAPILWKNCGDVIAPARWLPFRS